MDEDGMQNHVEAAGHSDAAQYSWNPARTRPHFPGAQPPARIRTDMPSAALGDSVENEFMMPDLSHAYWTPDSATDGAGRVMLGPNSGGLASEAGLRPASRPDRLPPGPRQSHINPNAGPMAPAGGLADPTGWGAQQQISHYSRQHAPSYPPLPTNISQQKTPSEDDARHRPQATAQPPKPVPMPLPSPVSTRSPCSDVLRDHGMDIDEVLSRLDSQRRCSAPPPPQPRISKVAHGRVHKSEYVVLDRPRHRPRDPKRQAAPDDDPADAGPAEEEDRRDQQHREWRPPRVKKVVVIYMSEEGRG